MNRRTSLALALTFALGATAGWSARRITPETYAGKEPNAAARALLEEAAVRAKNASWERIAVGRVYYLGGMKEEGQAIFDSVLGSRKAEGGDWIRVGRVYYDAGEWEKAKAAFERVIELEPEDAPWLAEIGAYHNLQGDRAKAEQLFRRSFEIDSEEVWHTVHVAGSYVGVVPR
jgi:tetratricopeptide (TPR) repeat protein